MIKFPEQADSRVKKPRAKAQAERTSEGSKEALVLAFILTALFHLVFVWATPAGLPEKKVQRIKENPIFDVTLEPRTEEEEQLETYVRAAPDVVDKTPEETNNISDRNQQAAQPDESLPDPENTPSVEGDEEESNRLVQGDPFSEPTPSAPPESGQQSGDSPMVQQIAAPSEQQASEARPIEEQSDEVEPDPIRALEQEPTEEEGLASAIEVATAEKKPSQPEAQIAEAVTLSRNVVSPENGEGDARQSTPAQSASNESENPRPRKRVARDTSYGPIKDNRQGAISVGRLAFDAKYSEFGEYWRRIAEIIESRWRNLVYNTKAIPFGGYQVVVEFKITREGNVEDVKVAYSTAGRLAETISIDAIVGEAPFFEWTPEMIVKMGEMSDCSIHFYY